MKNTKDENGVHANGTYEVRTVQFRESGSERMSTRSDAVFHAEIERVQNDPPHQFAIWYHGKNQKGSQAAANEARATLSDLGYQVIETHLNKKRQMRMKTSVDRHLREIYMDPPASRIEPDGRVVIWKGEWSQSFPDFFEFMQFKDDFLDAIAKGRRSGD